MATFILLLASVILCSGEETAESTSTTLKEVTLCAILSDGGDTCPSGYHCVRWPGDLFYIATCEPGEKWPGDNGINRNNNNGEKIDCTFTGICPPGYHCKETAGDLIILEHVLQTNK
ncbi:hypothetical protein L9F63_015434 [Diploptera punctata]|uniref:Uncharacterized protein n=1 Tax=Diploptera punctata TaxID=6984 RepID=A0AAD8EJU8_DIPPU|nr:hypothetical protein L9F63_015434 [Diploptera punctata]